MAINILFGLTLFFFSLGQIGRLSPLEIPAFINLYEIFLVIVTALLILKVKNPFATKRGALITSLLLLFSFLGVSLGISLFYYNGVQNILAVLYFGRLVFYYVFFIYFLAYIEKVKSALFYKRAVFACSALIIGFSLLQYFLYPNIGNIAYAGWDPHLYRLVGLFFDPPLTAGVFFLLALGAFYIFKNKYIKYSLMVVFGVLFFLTYSRGGFLALFATILLYSFRKMKPTYVIAFFAVSAVLIMVIPKNMSEGLNLTRTTSIQTRLTDYNKAYRIWQKSPIIGIGYNHIRAEKDSYEEEPITEKYNPSHASASFHSSFLIILVTGGVIGLLLYIPVLLKTIQLNEFALYSTVFVSVYSLTDNLLLHPFILFLWFFLIGVTLRVQSER